MEIFAIGIDDGAVKTELNKIASEPLTNHVFTVNYGRLEVLSSSLARIICEGNKLSLKDFYTV